MSTVLFHSYFDYGAEISIDRMVELYLHFSDLLKFRIQSHTSKECELFDRSK